MSPPNLDLSVVLPCYEEAANLRLLLPRLLDTLRALKITAEVLVIDTVAPRDETEAICAENGVRCIRRSPTDAFGDAYRTGIAETRGRHVLFMDADGSHAPEFIGKLYPHAGDFDVVIASRYVKGGKTENHPILELMSRVLNLTYALVLRIRCHDMSNSFKIYDGDRLRAIDLRCENFDVVEEIMVGLARDGQGLRIKEIPFTFQKREEGKSKRNLILFILSYCYTLMRLRFRSWKSKPLTPTKHVPFPNKQQEKARRDAA